jgi:hypothetical protein
MNIRDIIFFNGISGDTGDYLFPPLPAEVLARLAMGERPDPERKHLLEQVAEARSRPNLAPAEGVDPKRLDKSGWGVVFAARDQAINSALKEALGELLALRRVQAGERYRELTLAPGQSATDLLAELGVGPGWVDPRKVPYYLLIVGDPEAIPFLVQYATYARSVVDAEAGGPGTPKLSLPRRAVFFGVENEGDLATERSARDLVEPLGAFTRGWAADYRDSLAVETILRRDATKERLKALLGGPETPALLFTASHGLGFRESARQLAQQGALLCDNWGGLDAWGWRPIPQDFYVAADDIDSEARVAGLIAFHFACYSAGTPRCKEVSLDGHGSRTVIAPRSFVAELPRRLLGHPRGGALAVVGHVERAWDCSFNWGSAGPQRVVFESALTRLLEGYPVGAALEPFGARYAQIATILGNRLDKIKGGFTPNEAQRAELAFLWTATNDARSFVLLGDPAVRLAATDGAPPDRYEIGSIPHREQALPAVEVCEDAEAAPREVRAPLPSEIGAPAPAPSASTAEGDIEVVTYTRPSMADVAPSEAGAFGDGAALRIVSRISPRGDVRTCVAEDSASADDALFKRHAAMVAEVLERVLSARGTS